MNNGDDDLLAIPPEFDRRKGKNREAAVLHHDPTEPRAKKTTKETEGSHLNGPNGKVCPNPPDTPEPPGRHPTLGEPAATYDYRDAEGRRIGIVYYFETRDGETSSPLTLCHEDEKPIWKWREFNHPAPLFGLGELVNTDAIVFVHGDEKSAIAGSEHFPDHVHATWRGDANAICNTDWSPLKNRRVIVWPKADLQGETAAQAVADAVLAAHATKVKIAQPLTELGEGADASYISSAQILEYAQEQIKNGRVIKPQWDDFRLLSWADLAQQPDREPLIKGVLDQGALSLMFGDSGAAKSFLVVDIGLHVATGRTWHDRKVRQGAVVHIAAEGSGGIKRRLEAQSRYHGIEPNVVPFYVLPRAIDLCRSDSDTDELIKAIGQIEGNELIVVDTISRALGGGDENSSYDMGTFVKNCEKLRLQTGAHVMLVHHPGKDASRGARGHSLLRAAVDTEIQVTKSNDEVTLKVTKQRDIASGGTFTASLVSVEISQDEDGEAITSCVVIEAEPSKAEKPLTGYAKTAYEALVKVADDIALASPNPNPKHNSDRTSRVCPVIVWREEFRTRCVDAMDIKPDTFQKRFTRSAESLEGRGLVGFRGGKAWVKNPSRTNKT